jgi:hypothetical protein
MVHQDRVDLETATLFRTPIRESSGCLATEGGDAKMNCCYLCIFLQPRNETGIIHCRRIIFLLTVRLALHCIITGRTSGVIRETAAISFRQKVAFVGKSLAELR